jgi:hypothetical protein
MRPLVVTGIQSIEIHASSLLFIESGIIKKRYDDFQDKENYDNGCIRRPVPYALVFLNPLNLSLT